MAVPVLFPSEKRNQQRGKGMRNRKKAKKKYVS